MDRLAKTMGVVVAVAGLLLLALLWTVGATAAPSPILGTGELRVEPLAPDASITLSNAPSPPTAIRPGETQSIQWQIIASTTPVSVSFRIINLDTSALVDSQVYPGATGMSVTRGYTLPPGYTLPFGRLFERYRIQPRLSVPAVQPHIQLCSPRLVDIEQRATLGLNPTIVQVQHRLLVAKLQQEEAVEPAGAAHLERLRDHHRPRHHGEDHQQDDDDLRFGRRLVPDERQFILARPRSGLC